MYTKIIKQKKAIKAKHAVSCNFLLRMKSVPLSHWFLMRYTIQFSVLSIFYHPPSINYHFLNAIKSEVMNGFQKYTVYIYSTPYLRGGPRGLESKLPSRYRYLSGHWQLTTICIIFVIIVFI